MERAAMNGNWWAQDMIARSKPIICCTNNEILVIEFLKLFLVLSVKGLAALALVLWLVTNFEYSVFGRSCVIWSRDDPMNMGLMFS